jgi:hypothetical protein
MKLWKNAQRGVLRPVGQSLWAACRSRAVAKALWRVGDLAKEDTLPAFVALSATTAE